MHEKPAEAVRAKPDSSLVAACRAVGDGEADAVVSAGNTGAMLAAGLLHIRRLPGRVRPAIAVVVPGALKPSVLIDAGANADARPEHLLQFAHMGVVFAEEILGVRDPVVRLLSIGEEPEKGNQLTLEAHALLAASRPRLRRQHRGARPPPRARADVVVTDGFTGNVALKLLEGTISELLDELRSEIVSTRRGKLGGLLIRPAARRLRGPARPRYLRRRVPARPARALGRRARELLQPRDRERNPARGRRGRASGRRAAGRAPLQPCSIGALLAPAPTK